jgi:hypothetical protein
MRWQGSRRLRLSFLLGVFLLLSSCTFLSNQAYVQQYPQYRGIKRVAVFVQRWPAYLQLPNQNNPGADFIKKSTLFTGPWQPAGLMNPRAVDVQDIDDNVAASLLIQVLTEKGYQPFLSGVLPLQPGPITVEEIMARCEAINRGVEAILFCFYSPTVFFAEAAATPKDHQKRSYSLQEIIGILNPGGNSVTWAGPRAAQAPPNSISHAFIFVSLTMFKVLDWRPLWEVADSQVGRSMRIQLAQCPPAPTDQNFPADAGIMQRLMCGNLACRLRHLIPDAF